MHASFNGNSLLKRVQELLIEKPEGWRIAAIRLCDKLTEYLRETRKKGGEYKHPVPNWEAYPLARSFYTQMEWKVRL